MYTALIQFTHVLSSQYTFIYLRPISVTFLSHISWSSKWQLTKVSPQKLICVNSLFPSICPAHLSKRPRFIIIAIKSAYYELCILKYTFNLFLLSPNMFLITVPFVPYNLYSRLEVYLFQTCDHSIALIT
jgi:hypothetical protein